MDAHGPGRSAFTSGLPAHTLSSLALLGTACGFLTARWWSCLHAAPQNRRMQPLASGTTVAGKLSRATRSPCDNAHGYFTPGINYTSAPSPLPITHSLYLVLSFVSFLSLPYHRTECYKRVCGLCHRVDCSQRPPGAECIFHRLLFQRP